jgi:pilus assembly protein CpaC
MFFMLLCAMFLTAGELPRALEFTVGQGRILDFTTEVTRVYTSNPDVADVSVIDAHQIIVNAKAPGQATLAIWLQSGRSESIPVTVAFDVAPIQKLLTQAFPDDQLTVSGTKEALVLLGKVHKAATVDRALALLKPFAPSLASGVESLGEDKQIALHVVFAELDRTASSSFGMNLLSTGAANTPGQVSTGQFSPAATNSPLAAGSPTSFNLSNTLNVFAFRPDLNLAATIQALQSKGVLQILAEPDLVTTDGKEAHFTVGGEFPVPVPQSGAVAGAITIQFREYGIRLSFTPSTTSNGTIKLHVQPEVSTIDTSNGIVLSGFNVPALSTRKIETEVELNAGQSFVIAGLLDNRVTQNLSKIPGIGDIPILGALFRSHSLVRSKTELVIIVTPDVRTPLPPGTPGATPAMPVPFLPPATGEAAKK